MKATLLLYQLAKTVSVTRGYGYLLVLLRAIGEQNTFALHVFVNDALQRRHVRLDDIFHLNTQSKQSSLVQRKSSVVSFKHG